MCTLKMQNAEDSIIYADTTRTKGLKHIFPKSTTVPQTPAAQYQTTNDSATTLKRRCA